MARRNIPLGLVQEVLTNPGQIVGAFGGRKAYQSVLEFPDGRKYLLRVIVGEAGERPIVVTVYRTSKIAKYWSAP